MKKGKSVVCDVCGKTPARFVYRGQRNCFDHYNMRRSIFERFARMCQTPEKCNIGQLPASCERCGFDDNYP